ncbi:MAG TPA: rRNA maturation RNase YbeY [Candidatus Avalokitesvara rifleensis]|uniref:rRNA maturation RNase YbeY n=1 Tax=Candidatus Avalokitesvara rifleensis TaxID=3367620 RepID=UPI00271424D7|nr:rRNA maturation RNase YbeY [Candidatus Brocadiales bacterium]
MRITITNLQNAYPIKRQRIREVVKAALCRKKVDAELSIVFVDKDEITRLNKKFLGHKGPTDVLSFPLETNTKCITGEVVVCVPMAIEYVAGAKTEIEGEIMLYVVHGVLHLLGYDDADNKSADTMHRVEKEILAKLGYTVADS